MKNIRAIKRRDERAPISVSDAVKDFLASPNVKRLAHTTQVGYTSELVVFANWCDTHGLAQNRTSKEWHVVSGKGQISLDQINDRVMMLYLDDFKQTHRPSRADREEISTYTLSRVSRVIKTFLNWCVLDEQYSQYVLSISIQRIKKPKVEEVIIETFTIEQIEALFAACDREESEHLQVRDRAILACLLDSGIRAHELCTLTIENVCLDSKDAHIRVFGKGGKWGEVGLGEQARRAIQKYVRMFREPTIEYEIREQLQRLPARQAQQIKRQALGKALVFVNRSGKALTISGLYRMVDRLGSWAGIEGVRCSPHTFRHTMAAMFIRNGGNIYQLSKLLRHASVSTTEEYLKSLRQSEARKGAKSVLDNL